MSEFKFACPSCGQHIKTDSGASGRRIACPTCHDQIVIPSPPGKPGGATGPTPARTREPAKAREAAADAPTKIVVSPPLKKKREGSLEAASDSKARAKPSGDRAVSQPLKIAVKPAPMPEAPTEAPGETPVASADPDAAPVQIASLTPAIKLEVVRSARERIADESHWLPGKTESKEYAYAAKVSGGKAVLVEVTNPEATRFSLIGAVLLEFHRRNVTQTASGRRDFLDKEITAAVQVVLRGGSGGRSAVSEEERGALTHSQCLQVLEVLEERYTRAMAKAETAEAERELEDVRAEDLLRKLEKQAPIAPEDVATALIHELEEVKKRLTALERASGISR